MWKMIGNILKRFPHPAYGYYGGYYRRCKTREQGTCPVPIDWMDRAFQKHDSHTLNNKQLVYRLVLGNPYTLDRMTYGRLYRLGTIAVFSIANYVSN